MIQQEVTIILAYGIHNKMEKSKQVIAIHRSKIMDIDIDVETKGETHITEKFGSLVYQTFSFECETVGGDKFKGQGAVAKKKDSTKWSALGLNLVWYFTQEEDGCKYNLDYKSYRAGYVSERDPLAVVSMAHRVDFVRDFKFSTECWEQEDEEREKNSKLTK